MALGLIGKKVGMTRLFDQESGAMVPVTVIDVKGNTFAQIKTEDKDGYNAIQVAFDAQKESRVAKPQAGHFKKLYKKTYRIRLSRSTDGQLKESNRIARRNLREGDLVFFTSRASRKRVAHVGIYLKDGKFIHASTSQGVIVSNLKERYYTQYWLCGGRVK